MDKKFSSIILIVIIFLVACCSNGVAYEFVKINDKLQFGHAPFWDPLKLSWYYTDLLSEPSAPQLFRYDYATAKVFSATIREHTGGAAFIVPIQGKLNEFAVGIDLKVLCVRWDGVSSTAIQCGEITSIPPSATNTTLIHFGIADETGRLYIKNFNKKLCSDSTPRCGIYKVLKNGVAQVQIANLKSPSGVIWNKILDRFYYTDLCQPIINECIWDPLTGDLTSCRIIQTINNPSYPGAALHSLAVDRSGDLYFFLFNIGVLYKINPLTSAFSTTTLPVPTLVHLAFGGPRFDELFITTASVILNPADGTSTPAIAPGSGSSYILTGIGANGFPADKVDL